MFELFFLRLTKRKRMFSVPLVIIYFVLPILSFFIYKQKSDIYEEFVSAVVLQMHVWIPMLSSWWVILMFHSFFENEGNEVLYIHVRPLQFLLDYLGVFFLYSFFIVVFSLVFRFFVPYEIFVIGQLLAESLFISSAVFFMCFAVQKTGVGLLMAIAYCVYLNLFDYLKLFKFLSVFPESRGMDAPNLRLIKICIVGSMLCILMGTVLSKFRRAYK